MKHACLVALLLLVATCGAIAADEEEIPLELQVRYGLSRDSYVINKDGTAVETHRWSMTLLKETAIEWAKQSSVSYSTSAQRGEVLEAYTTKADGRRIDVPKDNYQMVINRGKGRDSPVYSDVTTLSVVFPDVAVGDTVTFSYRITQTEPLFPGHFSVAQTLPVQFAIADYRVSFDYPASMWVQFSQRGLEQVQGPGKDGRKVMEWRYANPQPARSERKNFTVIDPDVEPGFAFSTFRSYEDIAVAYGRRALPKAAVTERIRDLATKVAGDAKEPREQARLLYEWVAKNITYGGNCIGIGAVVPRDLPFILDNKMGDCKDHATLLQSLLAARGIKSTQALVNSGSVYRLPKVPVVSTVNHVINYLPDFDLYVDSTSNATPFGMLPFQDQDKPVLLVEGFKADSRTPVPAIGSNRQTTKSVLAIGPDGAISGSVDVFQKGESAVQSRYWARMLTKEWEADFVKNMFHQQGAIGSGKFSKDDPAALTDEYHFKADLKMEKFTRFPGSGAFFIYPVFATAGSVQNFLTYSMEPEKNADVACSNGWLREEYAIELPEKMKVLSVPDDLDVSNSFIRYRSTYKLEGRLLSVIREIDDRTKGNVCSPQTMTQYRDVGEKIMDDLKAQVLYK